MPWRSASALDTATSNTKWSEGSATAEKLPVTPARDTSQAPTVSRTAVDALLPPPVQAPSLSSRRAKPKSARIEGGLRVHWARFKKRLGTGSAPSSSSVVEDSLADSSLQQSFVPRRVSAAPGAGALGDDAAVDEVVVEREWGADVQSSEHSDAVPSPERSGSHAHGGTDKDRDRDRDSYFTPVQGFWAHGPVLIALRWRVWPAVVGFFSTRFVSAHEEAHYRKENWFFRKSLALWSAAFYILNWVLACIFVPKPLGAFDKYFYLMICTILTVPLPFLIIYDFPRDRPKTYQAFLAASTWMWSCYQVVYIYTCGYYGPQQLWFNCGTKDFLQTFYFTSAVQTIALFGLMLNRLPTLLGATVFLVLSAVLVVPERVQWTRNILNFLVYQAFLLYVHYMRENAERRLYTLREQLKVQFRATQKAQVNERKASDSKRRLTSYVFHEVRVPLNTALLAVQNMEADGAVPKAQEIEFKALTGSLSMMSKVLNDVLDFNRMDSGRFESVAKPYAFHQTMRSMFIPLRLATNARQLEFVIDLDENIDLVARKAAYEAMGLPSTEIARRLADSTDEDGLVVGDETRLRQIVTNLASNACKFTPAGGKLIIATRLVLPAIPPTESPISAALAAITVPPVQTPSVGRPTGGAPLTPGSVTSERGQLHTPASHGERDRLRRHDRLSSTHLTQHNAKGEHATVPLEWIVVRIEVTDTGCGIRPKDMAKSKLFSAFTQTEQGRQQGGKGTGLGLALVRQIVKLSGGRLGVMSKVGVGSTFWVEIPFAVGTKALAGLTAVAQQELRTGAVPGADGPHRPSFARSPTGGEVTLNQIAPNWVALPASSALHSIMEQGGLVELVPGKQPTSSTRVTRTLGDLSSPSPPSTASGPVPARPPLQEHSSTETMFDPPSVRPTYVKLPDPPVFPHDTAGSSTEGESASSSVAVPKERDFALEPPPTPAPPPAPTIAVPAVTPTKKADSPTSLTAMGAGAGATPAFEPGLAVLVVDDDSLTRTLMRRMLTRMGCVVTTAENGEVALDLISGARPDDPPDQPGGTKSRYAVVFLDNQMPVCSGLEAVARLRELGRSDFVVGVTGNALLSDQEEYIAAGVDHVLIKPVLERSLRNMLVIADERRRANLSSVTTRDTGHDRDTGPKA